MERAMQSGVAGSASRVRFAREADMLAVLLGGARWLAGPRRAGVPYFEVQTMRGVVDVVFAELDEEVLVRRRGAGLAPAVGVAAASVILALSAEGTAAVKDGLSATELAARSTVTVSQLRRTVLPELVELGWVEQSGDRWKARTPYESPLRRVVAVEIKRDRWRSALAQAANHGAFAEATYVALDAAHAPAARSSAFRAAGVGLISVDAQAGLGAAVKVLNAPERRPRGLPRAVLGERILALQVSGLRSGPVAHVFGRHLTTSSGPDLRRHLTLSP